MIAAADSLAIEEVLAGRRAWWIVGGDARDLVRSADLSGAGVVVTDPPFGIGYESGSTGTSEWHGKQIANDGDTSCRDDVLGALSTLPALVFGSWRAAYPTATRTALIWDKGPALGMGALDLPWKPSFEMIFVLGRGFHGYRDGAVIHHPPVQSMAKNGRLHPNEKPVGLLIELLQKCPPGVVVDPFCGSGSTGVAALRSGRGFIGCEIDASWFQLAYQRISAEEVGSTFEARRTGQLALLGDGK